MEKDSPSLQKLPEDFYSGLSDLISKLEGEYRESALKLAGEICASRKSKILRLASRTGESTPPNNMAALERGMYDELLAVLSRYDDKIFRAGKHSEGGAPPAREDKIPETGKPQKKGGEEKSDDGKINVRIIKPLPAIIGSDMTHYGPFEEGMEIKLPADTAKILIEQGAAEGV